MNARIHIQRGEQRVERAGGGLGHERVVQPAMVAVARLALDVAVLLVDLRGLGETGLLFVHRLGDEDARVVFVEVEQHRRAVLHHRDELLVADPRRVEQDVVAQLADTVDHLPGVVDGAVIGAQLNDRQTEWPWQLRLVRGDFA